jgi:TIR domain
VMVSDRAFDVCLSFASEQRDYVRDVDTDLDERGVNCFFDERRRVDLWGKDLAEHFDDVFRKQAEFCVAFISREWVEKTWPTHERRSALARALVDDGYFLPVRLDDTEVPGLRATVAYIDGRITSSLELADMISQKVRTRAKHRYLPPYPNRIFAAIEMPLDDPDRRGQVLRQARDFLFDLEEMTEHERTVVLAVLRYACPCSLPSEAHVSVDRLKRVAGFNMETLTEVVTSLKSVSGTSLKIEDDPDGPLLRLGWQDMRVSAFEGPATEVVHAMVTEAGARVCETCYARALDRLDFSRTSSLLDREDNTCVDSDLEDCPSWLRPTAETATKQGWMLEMASDQVRFRTPRMRDFIVGSLAFTDDLELRDMILTRLRANLVYAGVKDI